jgi:hypothetical protein
MSLKIITGTDSTMNHDLICMALENYPSILIDASNSANVHNFQGYSPENFANVYVVEVEALYRLTATLKKIANIARERDTKNIFITTMRLYNYDDENEIRNIFIHAWEIFAHLSGEFNIFAAVEKGSIHEQLARLNGAKEVKMGHTLTSQRMIVDNILGDLKHFERSLCDEDREIYTQLLREPLKHLGSITYTSSMNTWAILLLCIMLEREKMRRMVIDERDSRAREK